MKLPNAGAAVVEIEKLRDYCLNSEHPRGRHKARVFASALGLTPDNADELREAILQAAGTTEALPTTRDGFGQRFVLDFAWDDSEDSPLIRTTWIVRSGEAFPRLTSCYVL